MFEYDEIIYLLDLCIFSYQLHAQTLIWPLDPYYEQLIVDQHKKPTAWRKDFMAGVRQHFVLPATDEATHAPHLYRGPGSIFGAANHWQPNDELEPIISDYSRIYPWRPSFTRPNRQKEDWIVYNTPKLITDRINVVKMFRYSQAHGPNGANPLVVGGVAPLFTARPATVVSNKAATDWLYCFEGGTGIIPSTGIHNHKYFPIWSLMGYVLVVRDVNPGNNQLNHYDLVIVFRGSRSGKLRPKQTIHSERGNPDWVTDTDSLGIGRVKETGISQYGKVYRGFANSLRSIMPTLTACLNTIEADHNGAMPRSIYVTGHSLGGALATQFVSSMVLGDRTPWAGLSMNIQNHWPWNNMKLVTYGSPSVGNEKFAKSFNQIGPKCLRVTAKYDPITGTVQNTHVGELVTVDSKHEVTDQHNPKVIRHIFAKNLTVPEFNKIPGSQGGVNPWTEYKTAKDVLYTLLQIQNDLRQCLPDFNTHLVTLISILKNSLSGLSTLDKTNLTDIETILTGNNFSTHQELQNTLTTLFNSTVKIHIEEELTGYLALSIIFAFISRQANPVNNLNLFSSVKVASDIVDKEF